jgi:hypothetical protein
VNVVAYLRREVENVETDFPIDKVREAISKTVMLLEWTVEESDETAHKMKIKTKANFMAYASLVVVELTSVKEGTTRIRVAAETPVTTLTGIVDFGRTRERIDTFLMTMMAQLAPEKPAEPEVVDEPKQTPETKKPKKK